MFKDYVKACMVPGCQPMLDQDHMDIFKQNLLHGFSPFFSVVKWIAFLFCCFLLLSLGNCCHVEHEDEV